eukprot:2939301-Amphidinium_carterae.1
MSLEAPLLDVVAPIRVELLPAGSHGCKSEGVACDEMGGLRGAGPPLYFCPTSPTCATRSGAEATQRFRVQSANSEPAPCHVVALPDVLPREESDCQAASVQTQGGSEAAGTTWQRPLGLVERDPESVTAASSSSIARQVGLVERDPEGAGVLGY